MTRIEGLTDSPKQRARVVLPDGDSLYLDLEYIDQQLGWFVWLSWGDNRACGPRRLVPHPNMMKQWSDITGWGILVETTGQVEITGLRDLTTNTRLYLLGTDDLVAIEPLLSNG